MVLSQFEMQQYTDNISCSGTRLLSKAIFSFKKNFLYNSHFKYTSKK